MRNLLALILCIGMHHAVAALEGADVVRDDQLRIITVTTADGHAWKYTRDQTGRICTVMIDVDERWDIAVNHLGVITAVQSPDGPVDLTGATAVWHDLSLVLKRAGKPDRVLIHDPQPMRVL